MEINSGSYQMISDIFWSFEACYQSASEYVLVDLDLPSICQLFFTVSVRLFLHGLNVWVMYIFSVSD